MPINPAEQYHKGLPGFSGLSHGVGPADKQIHGSKSGSKPGTESSKTAARNASIDGSVYHDMIAQSLLGIPSQPKNLIQPSNQSGHGKVGS